MVKKVKPIEVIKGKTYKNFKGHYRTVKDIFETAQGVNVLYIDDTNTERIVKIDTFRQWVKKNYY